MKMKDRRLAASAVLLGVLFLASIVTGCEDAGEIKLVNEQSFSIADVSNIRLDYDDDDVFLLESGSADIVLKEYMDIDKAAYYARVTNDNGKLSIGEGQRPSGNRLNGYVELYLPAGCEADISIHTTESTLTTRIGHTLAALHTETTHGTLDLANITARAVSVSSPDGTVNVSNVKAETISFDTTNAVVTAKSVYGTIQYATTNGELVLTDAHGSGSFNASSGGSFDLAFSEITGDIKVTAKNSTILFTAPQNAAFHFIASSRNGSVNTDYENVAVSDVGKATGDVGDNPLHTVDLETQNGDIEAR